MESSARNRFIQSLLTVIMLIYFAFALFPIVWMVLISLKSQPELFTTKFVFKPTIESYKAITIGLKYLKGTGSFRPDFPRFFLNSIIISTASVAISVIVGVPAAYALARFKFPGKENLAFTFLSFRFAPELSVIIPLSILYRRFGLYDTYVGIIWVYQLITLPLLIWVLRGYFEDISTEIEQAAMTDGYTYWEVFWKILLPLIRPGLAASALLAFVFAWNNFIFAMILGGGKVQTVTVAALSFLASEQAHYNQMAAASLISAVPQIILALIIQKSLVRGLTFGAVKG
ncbi:MAG TPA: carbohydrate ABC transporter permease [Firmicutes bacterium]|nr:carbohydrate ABC transporter permease [Bacillota bacterium]